MKKSPHEIVQRTCGRGTGSSINGQGDWLTGGSGSDTLIGSQAKDVLMGGGGTDLLIGGAGDEWMRWRTRAAVTNSDKAANDETANAWRDAA